MHKDQDFKEKIVSPTENLTLPDPFVAEDGTPIKSAAGWFGGRRAEVLDLFRTDVFGRNIVERPDSLTFSVEALLPGAPNGRADGRIVQIGYEGPGGKGTIRLSLFVPKDTPGPVPVFLLICNRAVEDLGLDRTEPSPFWPVESIVARGYATAAFQVADIDPDEHDDFKNGLHGIFDTPGQPRSGDAWGTIAAWAWGASRCIDYFEEADDIDHRRVAVLGHSRGGKTALWCGAQDQRVALTISNESGCTGAAIARRCRGETIQDINERFPHWFCRNYRHYNGHEETLPVDQHMLIALLAPRLAYIASATDDAWSDPEGEFEGGLFANPVYELLGETGLAASTMPPPDTPIHDGRIGYHIRSGGHDLAAYDWACYLDYADRWLR